MSKEQLRAILTQTTLSDEQKTEILKAYDSKLPREAENLRIKKLAKNMRDLGELALELRR